MNWLALSGWQLDTFVPFGHNTAGLEAYESGRIRIRCRRESAPVQRCRGALLSRRASSECRSSQQCDRFFRPRGVSGPSQATAHRSAGAPVPSAYESAHARVVAAARGRGAAGRPLQAVSQGTPAPCRQSHRAVRSVPAQAMAARVRRAESGEALYWPLRLDQLLRLPQSP
jgi:hypothetical protein